MLDVIKYPVAYSIESDKLVDIQDATRGRQGLVCPDPECKSPMEACQGSIREWYFRHEKASACGYLHYTILRLLHERLDAAIATYSSVAGRYSCDCGRSATFPNILTWNQLPVTNLVQEKRSIEGAGVFPDLALRHLQRTIVLIEVVDSHRPEGPVIATGLPILEVNASWPLLHTLLEDAALKQITVANQHNIPCDHAPKGFSPQLLDTVIREEESVRHSQPKRNLHDIAAGDGKGILQYFSWENKPQDITCQECGRAMRPNSLGDYYARCFSCNYPAIAEQAGH